MNYASSYKGIYYKYIPPKQNAPYWERGVWVLSDRQDNMGLVLTRSATKYRIDQCFDEYFKEKNNYE